MIEIKVPATSANLGPGFDCLGLALSLYNYFYIKEEGSTLSITGCPEEYCGKDNLFYASMEYTAAKFKKTLPKGLSIHIKSYIPVARGLGSSAACVIGGILGAKEILKLPLTEEEIIIIASEIEGHPDNAAPALLGGITAAVISEDKLYVQRLPLGADLKLAVIIPDFPLSTEVSREVLPQRIDRADGVFNIGRTALLVAALINGDYDSLKAGFQDRLHQPYRAPLIKGYEDICREAKNLKALGICLSGAGPTLLSILKNDDKSFIPKMSVFLKELQNNWELLELPLNLKGASIKHTT